MAIFIDSTLKVISASTSAGVTRVYFENTSLPKGRTIILQHLEPKTFWMNNVQLENGAESELLAWLRKQKKLEVLCIQQMSCCYFRNAAKTVFYSPYTLNVASFYLEDQQLSAKCLETLSRILEYNQTMKELTMNNVKVTCNEETLSFVLMKAWRIPVVGLSGRFLPSVAISFVYALKASGKSLMTKCIEIDLQSRMAFKLFLSIIQKQQTWRLFRVKQGQLLLGNTEEALFNRV